TTRAACTNRTRRYRLPRFDILPRMVRSPVEICFGTSPSLEVATFGERLAGADRGHHGARDNRSDTGNAHQPFAAGVLGCDGCYLIGQVLDTLIEAAPILAEALDDAYHARRQHIGRRGQDAWQLSAQEP